MPELSEIVFVWVNLQELLTSRSFAYVFGDINYIQRSAVLSEKLPHWQAKDIRTLSCANADNNTYRLCLH
jgi:hypothetical protein